MLVERLREPSLQKLAHLLTVHGAIDVEQDVNVVGTSRTHPQLPSTTFADFRNRLLYESLLWGSEEHGRVIHCAALCGKERIILLLKSLAPTVLIALDGRSITAMQPCAICPKGDMPRRSLLIRCTFHRFIIEQRDVGSQSEPPRPRGGFVRSQ